MKYKEVIDLGFKHIEEGNDPQWLNEYGYEYFRVELKLDKRHYIDWDVQEQYCEVITLDGPKECNVLQRWKITDIELLKEIIRVFGKQAPKS